MTRTIIIFLAAIAFASCKKSEKMSSLPTTAYSISNQPTSTATVYTKGMDGERIWHGEVYSWYSYMRYQPYLFTDTIYALADATLNIEIISDSVIKFDGERMELYNVSSGCYSFKDYNDINSPYSSKLIYYKDNDSMYCKTGSGSGSGGSNITYGTSVYMWTD